MPGTRNAPPVDGTPNKRMVTFRFIDVSNDIRSIAIEVDLNATAAEIEALAAALQVGSNASLFEVQDKLLYTAQALAANGVNDDKSESVFANVVMLAKSATGDSENLFVPAPTAAIMVEGSDNPDQASTELLAIATAFEALAVGSKLVTSVRYTERREKNSSVGFSTGA